METSKKHISKLIALAKKKDQKAFSALLNIYWDAVYGFLLYRTKNTSQAEDISIRTFSKAFDKIHTYNTAYAFKTWLLTISKNIHIDQLRKQQNTTVYDFDREQQEVQNIIDSAPSIEDTLIIEQNLATLLEALKRLKPGYQKVIQLRYFQEYSYQEIAHELQEPLGSVKVKVLRAKKLLLELIKTKK